MGRGDGKGVGLDVSCNSVKGNKGWGKGERRRREARYWLVFMGRGRRKRGIWGEGVVRRDNNHQNGGRKGCDDSPVGVATLEKNPSCLFHI